MLVYKTMAKCRSSLICMIIESNFQDFFRNCSVHQHGRHDVTWESRFLSWVFPVIEHPNQKVTSSTPARSTRILFDFPQVIFSLIFVLMILIWWFPQEKKTALHLAAEKGRLEVCKHLLELRADICALDNVSQNSMFELRAWKFKKIFDQSKQTRSQVSQSKSKVNKYGRRKRREMLVWKHFVGLTFLPFFSGGEGRGEERRGGGR